MTWEIFLGIVALFSFCIAIVRPIISLTQAITQLNHSCTELAKDFEAFKEEYLKNRERIHTRIDAQESLLEEHEKRLHALDGEWSHGR